MKAKNMNFVVALMLWVLPVEDTAQSQYIVVKTRDGRMFGGSVRLFAEDTVLLVRSPGDIMRLHRDEILRIESPNKTNFLKTRGWEFGSGLILGSFFGLVQPIGTELDFTRGERVVAYGLGLAGLGTLISGTIAVLKSVDVDIPWQRLSPEQRRSILSQLASGTYRYGLHVRVAPWMGSLSVAETGSAQKEVTHMAGIRLRLHIKPPAGLEFAFARSGWYDRRFPFELEQPEEVVEFSSTSRARANYFSFTIFTGFNLNRFITPFASWGFALVKENIESMDRFEYVSGEVEELHESWTNTYMPFQVHAGVEILLMRWVSLEARADYISYFWQGDGHLGYQIGVNFGPMF